MEKSRFVVLCKKKLKIFALVEALRYFTNGGFEQGLEAWQ